MAIVGFPNLSKDTYTEVVNFITKDKKRSTISYNEPLKRIYILGELKMNDALKVKRYIKRRQLWIWS